MQTRVFSTALAVSTAMVVGGQAFGQGSFVNWETPHVNPIDVTPDQTKLLAVNTADNRLEIFNINDSGGLLHLASVPVGLDPVSVRARSSTEAWVVNHISDSVSIVNLITGAVEQSLRAVDEPTDVIFAGTPERAFVSVSQFNEVHVFDPENLSEPPSIIELQGEDPRALATDGEQVYVAFFESGNKTTVITEILTSLPEFNPYPNDENPPPNDGDQFSPPLNPDNPPAPAVGIIVKKQADGTWLDDNGFDWSDSLFMDVHDHDIAVIDAETLGVSYITGMMNLNMNLAVQPGTGNVTVIGTDARNEVRFEPNLQGAFLDVVVASAPAGGAVPDVIVDLNPHVFDVPGAPPLPAELRNQSIGEPRGIAWNAEGTKGWIAGLGSNNVQVINSDLGGMTTIDVGTGPTGVSVDTEHKQVYVLNKFDASITVISSETDEVLQTLSFYDPTPTVIAVGRKHLYDTHDSSGQGNVGCVSCHPDARMDNIGWDLGNPDGEMIEFDEQCINNGACTDFHPMKGPMTTQTLQGIIGVEPLHWRGDRHNLAEFNPTFVNLLARESEKSDIEMQEFEDFLATIKFPPNPFRNLDGGLSPTVRNGGNAITGEALFQVTPPTCVACHIPGTGSNQEILQPLMAEGITQNMKTAQMQNLHEKTGFNYFVEDNNRGFGFIHDGYIGGIKEHFLALDTVDPLTEEERCDLEAFMFSFSVDTHAGVGAQVTLRSTGDADDVDFRNTLLFIAESSSQVGLVVKGIIDGEVRGLYYLGDDFFQSDRVDEQIKLVDLDALVDDNPLTFTLVPFVSLERIGVDRDEDGFFDRDELDACVDPADPNVWPGNNPCSGDITGNTENVPDGLVDTRDMLKLFSQWGLSGVSADLDCINGVNTADLLTMFTQWGVCPD